ncbi:hypothetical protein DRO26_03435 [Candidatus Bathyarchaeota archaeon]|nr:MAG: hypothetical protein DRO26_03435 [Candidatus Bathyarchaeota archaeon]
MALVVITSFWLGTTVWILLFGTFSIKIRMFIKTSNGLKNLKICGMLLISIGINYMILTLTIVPLTKLL